MLTFEKEGPSWSHVPPASALGRCSQLKRIRHTLALAASTTIAVVQGCASACAMESLSITHSCVDAPSGRGASSGGAQGSTGAGRGRAHPPGRSQAENDNVGWIIAFSVLRFWDKNTMAWAGAMPFRWDFPATTRILSFEAPPAFALPFSAWFSARADERNPLLRTVLARLSFLSPSLRRG